MERLEDLIKFVQEDSSEVARQARRVLEKTGRKDGAKCKESSRTGRLSRV